MACQLFAQDNKQVMSAAYNAIWNEQVQEQIDDRIEKFRKVDASIRFSDIKKNSTVKVEQLKHDFIFGSNIFLFDQYKTDSQNTAYKNLFLNLFNAATIPFYWKTLEPEKGKPRFTKDSAPIYRRPATDPVVEFCEANNIDMNGHTIIYGMRRWAQPTWMPEDRKIMEQEFEQHIKTLAQRYQGRIQRWDIVNESIDQANRGLMPDDYTYKCYQWAKAYFPPSVLFNMNDCDLSWSAQQLRRYVEIIRNLKDRQAKVDVTGIQSHIFNPQGAKAIAEGAPNLTPDLISSKLSILDSAELPIHISEVTISAPDASAQGAAIQAQIARNLYRLWFSHPSIMGITWWNAVDGGAAEGEPSLSGILDENLAQKPVYHVLRHLIHQEWSTQIQQKINADSSLAFRGFKGTYKISWTDKKGKKQEKQVTLGNQANAINL
ncbi:glycosyltransferase [Sphingobacterium humi]|uniref:Glycosyltransferase n=2 Tax=Sphingobacterium humi TaxID=1796905 RepID=A0A6N8KVF2_9SPHI|nr:glycosyltransferase [Sphingobacterium humi]